MLRKLFVFLSAISLPLSQGNSAERRNPLSELVLHPQKNLVQDCVVSALYRNQVLVALMLDRAPTEQIELYLKDPGSSAASPEFQDLLIEEWNKSPVPGNIAALEFERCLNNEAPIGELGRKCFGLMAFPAHAEESKRRGYSKAKAIDELRKFAPEVLSDAFIKSVVDSVYEFDVVKTRYFAHRTQFAACIDKYLPQHLDKDGVIK